MRQSLIDRLLWRLPAGVIAVMIFGGFAAIALFVAIYVRGHLVDSCLERGGQPVTPSWWSGAQPTDVRCIEKSR